MRGIKWTLSIARQADVPAGAQVLANENGSAPGLIFEGEHQSADSFAASFCLARATARTSADVSRFGDVDPAIDRPGFGVDRAAHLRSPVWANRWLKRRLAKRFWRFQELSSAIARDRGKSTFESSAKEEAWNGPTQLSERAWILGFLAADETLEEVIVKLLAQRNETLAVAESAPADCSPIASQTCLAHRPFFWPVMFLTQTRPRSTCWTSIRN